MVSWKLNKKSSIVISYPTQFSQMEKEMICDDTKNLT